jgi:sn-glycerol 3-phosphate transport system substrate-binding protein
MKSKFLLPLSFTALVALASPAHAQVEIQWWHSMAGKLGDKVNEIAE